MLHRTRRCSKNAILPRVCRISRDAVDVDRLVDRLAMWIDDEGLDNAQATPRPQAPTSNLAATNLGSKRARRPRSGASLVM